MCHALPPPLSPRCFPVLVVTAFTSPTAFIAVTLPVGLGPASASAPAALVDGAYYSVGRNVTDPDPSADPLLDSDPGPLGYSGNREKERKLKRKKSVLGAYAAVETVRILPAREDSRTGRSNLTGESGGGSGHVATGNSRDDREEEGKGETIEWTMATASDAKGNLPMFLQRPNVPAAIVKDVGFLMAWTRARRERSQNPEQGADRE
jgi:hypothetical protein